jgi:glutamate/tyrosine decarboxylase-like PLP-dependent enzyme
VLGLPFEAIPSDDALRMDLAALETALERGGIGTVVVTVGTTVAGSVDPLPEILRLRKRYGFRVHADAAYGGYFTLADNLDAPARAALDHLARVDSLAVDPHKHGLQPYGCGCILFADPGVGALYVHDSPYTYFSSDELHLGEISLECSRPGAAAVALWATQRLLPPVPGGEFARGLGASRRAALALYSRLREDPRFVAPLRPELDIVLWLPRAASASAASRLSKAIFAEAAREHLHLATAKLPAEWLRKNCPEMDRDAQDIVCLRSCLMKPEHEPWLDTLWEVLDRATERALG